MKELEEKILPKSRASRSSPEKKSRDARKGRGADAFSAKITADQKDIDRRVEAIASRSLALGYIPVSYPIHVKLITVKGVKF